MILSCNNISKSFGENTILSDICFNINYKEKVAIIGVNGSGKSTLFKIITGEISSDFGEISSHKNTKIGYFSQNLEINSDNTIYNEFLLVFNHIIFLENEQIKISKELENKISTELIEKLSNINDKLEKLNAYEYRSRIKGVIKGLGFSEEDFNKKISTLSGGQKTRIALGKLLLSNPDLLLLDEPTNHLDIQSINWLESYLKSYSGSIIIISHDRYFIDKIVNKIIEIENKKAKTYTGSYSEYATKKEIDREIEIKHFFNQQKEIKKQEEVIKKLRSFNRKKSIKRAESREKTLSKMEIIEKPDNLPDKMRLSITPKKESGNDVLIIENLSKSFDKNKLFENISFEIKKGDKVALIGENGIGKTTLFKIILDKLDKNNGTVKLGSNVVIGYYDQEHSNLNLNNTIFDEISNTFPKMTTEEIRNALAVFVFTGNDVFKTISSLSGGEKGRVSLAKIMLSNSNFLILDEPTNHLDIISKEILENALKNYTGTYFFISHDRYFINNISSKIIELKKDGIDLYLGNYDYYLEKNSTENKIINNDISENEPMQKLDWKKQKELQSAIRKKENQITYIEKEITKTENKIKELDKLLETKEIFTNPQKSNEIFTEKNNFEKNLCELYEKWEELQN